MISLDSAQCAKPPTGKVLVTGGGGFLGKRIVESLLERGFSVRVASRQHYPELQMMGAECVRCDIRDLNSVRAAVTDIETIHHTASEAGYWGRKEQYYGTNVYGTKNVINAALEKGVKRLIYTSTPSVVGYRDDHRGMSNMPAINTHSAWYPKTKAIAEKMVLESNSSVGPRGPTLATLALRPHLIFGPGDRHLLPTLISALGTQNFRIVGSGENKVDLTYIDNAAYAHIDAQAALTDSHAACAGKAYFISNDEPVHLWPWINNLALELGLPPAEKKLSLKIAQLIGLFYELRYRQVDSSKPGPPLTRFLANALARDHWFDMNPSKRDLHYKIRVNMREGLLRTLPSLRERILQNK